MALFLNKYFGFEGIIIPPSHGNFFMLQQKKDILFLRESFENVFF